MLSLSTFQPKGHSQELFQLRNIQKMSPSNETLRDKFKTNVFDKGEMECQDKSSPIKLLRLLVKKVFKSGVKIKFDKL